jgi:hypothetical protein
MLGSLVAQVPDAPLGPPPPAQPAPASPGKAEPAPGAQTGTFLGKDIPRFDPKTELLTWDGKSWNINNNRLFQARFEKYLNAPEDTTVDARNYQTTIASILNLLAPGNASTANVAAAFALLPRGSSYDIDARLCDAIADAVYSAWKAQKAQGRLVAANAALDGEKRQEYWNAKHSDAGDTVRRDPNSGSNRRGNNKQPQGGGPAGTNQDFADTVRQTEHTKRIAEIEAQIKANQVKRELNEIQTKVEFQALILQLFLQRRFQHVLIATRFYRSVFTDGDTKLNVGKDTKDLFEKSAGMPPTVGTLDSLANEAIRDVREGVKAYEYLVSQHELESATKRLGEAFIAGEYVPEIRTLPREKKRQALEFTQKSNQLLSTMEAKDFTSAEKLLDELAKIAKDFDGSQARAGIETSRRISQMHLAKARNAAVSNDKKTLEEELAAAAALWPLNPALQEVSQKIFDQGDVQAQALSDFDQLVGEKNFRQIFENQVRFIAATALNPERQTQLKEILQNMQTIEAAILRAEEMRRQSNYPGAWESVERIAGDHPNDSKLNQVRADLTTQAADFVRTIRSAQDLEKKDQIGSSLAWFLKARKIYPASEFANEGIERLKKQILPES